MIAQLLWYESGLLWAFAATAAVVIVWILVGVMTPPLRRTPTPREQERLRQQHSNGEITLDEYYRLTRGSR